MSGTWFQIDEKELLTPKSGKEVIADSYWYRNGTGFLAFKRGNVVSYQTNRNREILERMQKYDNFPYKDYEIVHIPVAYVNIREY